MILVALYLTSAPELPKPVQKCDKCITPHIIQGSYAQVAYCILCHHPMPTHTKSYAR